MRSNGTSKSTLAAALVGVTLLLAAGSALAYTFTGFSGKAVTRSQESCMNEQDNSGGVINNCGAQALYEIPLPTNLGNFTVATYNPGGGTFWCQLDSASQTGGVQYGTITYPNVGYQTKTLTVGVPTGSSVFLYCNVNPNGIIYSVGQ